MLSWTKVGAYVYSSQMGQEQRPGCSSVHRWEAAINIHTKVRVLRSFAVHTLTFSSGLSTVRYVCDKLAVMNDELNTGAGLLLMDITDSS